MECVGARVYVLDAVNTQLIGTVGIITAVSKNCYFLAVDVDSTTLKPASTAKAILGVKNPSFDGASSVTTAVPITTKTTTTATATTPSTSVAPTALTLVKTDTTLGVVLPSLHSRHKAKQTLFTDNNSSDNAENNSADGFNSSTPYKTEGDNANDPLAQVGFKYDYNEREEGGRICILYGKHFMPHCKYD